MPIFTIPVKIKKRGRYRPSREVSITEDQMKAVQLIKRQRSQIAYYRGNVEAGVAVASSGRQLHRLENSVLKLIQTLPQEIRKYI